MEANLYFLFLCTIGKFVFSKQHYLNVYHLFITLFKRRPRICENWSMSREIVAILSQYSFSTVKSFR